MMLLAVNDAYFWTVKQINSVVNKTNYKSDSHCFLFHFSSDIGIVVVW